MKKFLFTLIAACSMCSTYAAPITGTLSVCAGSSTDLDNVTAGGTWSIAPASPVATINASTGIVAGLAAGTVIVTYTPPSAAAVTATVTVNARPAIFSMLGSTSICTTSGCADATLSGSETGVNYQVYKNGVATGAPVAGTSSPLILASQCTYGANTYSTVATNATTGCATNMSGTTVLNKPNIIDVDPDIIKPNAYYCAGTLTTTPVKMLNSSASEYKLYASTTVGGAPTTLVATVVSTGGPFSFPVYVQHGYNYRTSIQNPSPTHTCPATLSNIVTGEQGHSGGLNNATICLGDGPGTIGAVFSPYVTGPGWTQITYSSSDPSVATVGYWGYPVIPVSVGTTVVSVKSEHDCIGSATLTVRPPADAGFVVNDNDQPLVGNSFVFNPTSSTPGSHTWAFGDATSSAAATPAKTYGALGTYTVTHTMNDYQCAVDAVATMVMTVSPSVAPITGSLSVCIGSNTDLDNATPAGTWSIVPTSVATVNATTGVVTGIVAGTAIVTYATSSLLGTAIVTVNALPNVYNVNGTTSICTPSGCANVTLSGSQTGVSYQVYKNGTAAGSSINGTNASLTLASECTVGVNAYSVVATRTTTGCSRNMNGTATVSKPRATPAAADIMPLARICSEASGAELATPVRMVTTVANFEYKLYKYSTPMLGGPKDLMATITGNGSGMDFPVNTQMAHHYEVSVRDISITHACPAVESVPVTGDAGLSPHILSGTMCVTRSAANVNIIMPYMPTGLWGSGPVTVSYAVRNTAIASLSPATDLTPLSVGATQVITSSSHGCSDSATLTVAPGSNANFTVNTNPQPFTGNSFVFTPAAGTWGHSWAFGDAATATTAAPTHSYVAAGTYTVTHSIGGDCPSVTSVSQVMTVTGTPLGPIVDSSGSGSGSGSVLGKVLVGATIDLGNATFGGTWSIMPASAFASVHSTTGVVSGLAVGTAIVTYTAGGSSVMLTVTVSSMPGPVTGTLAVCAGSTTALGNEYAGGTWSVAPGAPEATIDATAGLLTGLAAGTIEVTYTAPSSAAEYAIVTVNAAPNVYNVIGSESICSGSGCGNISMEMSDGGVDYQLYKNGVVEGAPVAGYGGELWLASECATGINSYSVIATDATTGCSIAMNGNADIAIAGTFTPVTTDLDFCFAGSTTNLYEPARITSATEVGVEYFLLHSHDFWPSTFTEVDSVMGTGGPVSFAHIFAYSTMDYYKIAAKDPVTGCLVDVTWFISPRLLTSPVLNDNNAMCAGTVTDAYGISGATMSFGGDDYFSVSHASWAITNTSFAHIIPFTGTSGPGTDSVSADASGVTGLIEILSNGCSDTMVLTVLPVSAAAFTIDDDSQPLTGNSFTFTAPSTTGAHEWYFGDGADDFSGADVVSHSYTAVGTYTVTHSIFGGCYTAVSHTVTVTLAVLAPITGGSGSGSGSGTSFAALCVGATFDLDHTTPGGAWGIAPASSVATVNATTGVVSGLSAGTAIVTYTVGAGSVTTTVTVHAAPNANFTVNDATQELTGNSFTFTPVGSTAGVSYAWNFNDAATSTDIIPTHSYIAAGIYTVSLTATLTATSCASSSTQLITVQSDGVGGGGGDGGLESESLGGLVSQRDFDRIKNSIDKRTDYSKTSVFDPVAYAGPAAKGTATQAVSRLQRMVPASLNSATKAMVTSPAELTKITKAVDVFALDYVAGTTPKAVVLGITTLKKPYSHTKSICDRFRGGTLLYTEAVKIKGYDFIRFALRQPDGSLEFCIAFDAGKSAGRSTFNLQTSWLISQYKGDDSVFNFQAWATDPANTDKLVSTIIDNLNGIMPVQQVDTAFRVPPAYMAAGRRNKGSLDIKITNNTPITAAEIRFDEKVNEFAKESSISIPVKLKTGQDNIVSVPIGDGYEYPGYLYLNGQLVDAVYMADGNWSLDYDDKLTKVAKYTVVNDPDRIYVDNEYPLYRGLHVKATSNDYMMAYKFVTSGNEPVDLSGHRTIKFNAKGNGKMKVLVIKEGITKFAEQYNTTVTLDPAGKDYAISLADFTSTKKGAFTGNDVTAVVFSWNLSGAQSDFEFQASRLAFSPEEVPSLRQLRSKSLLVSPNPSNGAITLKFNSEITAEYDLAVVDVTGRVVYKQKVAAAQGTNTVNLTLPANLQRPAIYHLSMGNENTAYSAAKLSITE